MWSNDDIARSAPPCNFPKLSSAGTRLAKRLAVDGPKSSPRDTGSIGLRPLHGASALCLFDRLSVFVFPSSSTFLVRAVFVGNRGTKEERNEKERKKKKRLTMAQEF